MKGSQHPVNGDQNNNKRSPHIWKNGYHQKDRKITSVENKEPLVHSLWECKLGQPLWKLLQKLKNRTTTRSSNPPSGGIKLSIYLREIKSLMQREIFTPIFIATLFTTDKDKDEWLKKLVFMGNTSFHGERNSWGIILSMGKEILPFPT